MKYKVGDYIRLGISIHVYYRIEDIKRGRYVFRHLPDGKILRATTSFVDSKGITFVRVSRTEALLFSKKRKISGSK
jgi:hypothetical protein